MLNDKSILVTGGTGSFGRAFTRAVLQRFRPRRLVIYSRDELKQHEMHQEFNAPCMRYFLGDVRDRDRLAQAMRGLDVVRRRLKGGRSDVARLTTQFWDLVE